MLITGQNGSIMNILGTTGYIIKINSLSYFNVTIRKLKMMHVACILILMDGMLQGVGSGIFRAGVICEVDRSM
jgi:hypothetical protein